MKNSMQQQCNNRSTKIHLADDMKSSVVVQKKRLLKIFRDQSPVLLNHAVAPYYTASRSSVPLSMPSQPTDNRM
jgi:hypothetical protein